MLAFQHPALLAALPLLGLPIIAHLTRRETARPWPFPSLRWIEPRPLPRRATRQPRDAILLALRLLVTAGLILLAAGPRWISPLTAGEDLPTIIYLDCSASMAGWESWPRARQAVDELLASSGTANRPGLVAFSDRLEIAIPPGQTNARWREALQDLAPRPVRGRPAAGLAAAHDWLAGRPGRIIVISDLQETDWLAQEWPVLAARLEWIPTGRPRTGQLAWSAVRAIPAENGGWTVAAQVANSGAQPATTEAVLRAGGQSWSQTVTVPPRQTIPVHFDISARPAQAAACELGGDAYPLDNIRYFWLGAPPPRPVLMLAETNGSAPAAAEEFFLAQTWQAGQTDVKILAFDPRQSAEGLPAAAEILMVPAHFPAAIIPWPLLEAHLAKGGLLWINLGPEAVQVLREAARLGWAAPRYLGPAGVSGGRRERYVFAAPPPGGPLGDIFSGEGGRDLAMATVRRYARLESSIDSEVLLGLDNGDPFLIRFPAGRGVVVMMAAPADAEWTDLPLRNAFLPLVREVTASLKPPAETILSIECGDAWPGWLGASQAAPSTRQPGVSIQGGIIAEINVPAAESQPATVDPAELARRIEGPAAATANTGIATAAHLDLIPMLLAILGLVWLLEMFLSPSPPAKRRPGASPTPV